MNRIVCSEMETHVSRVGTKRTLGTDGNVERQQRRSPHKTFDGIKHHHLSIYKWRISEHTRNARTLIVVTFQPTQEVGFYFIHAFTKHYAMLLYSIYHRNAICNSSCFCRDERSVIKFGRYCILAHI